MGGETRADDLAVADLSGLSPAWAGKPTSTPIPRSGRGVYPRVGGETHDRGATHYYAQGLSPRGRGNQSRESRFAPKQGSIPAWAGKPPERPPSELVETVYPRVGGETAQDLQALL